MLLDEQTFDPKSTSVKDIDTERGRPETNRYEFAAKGLLPFPLPSEKQVQESRVAVSHFRSTRLRLRQDR